MDTIYIKMCDCKEIQGLEPREDGERVEHQLYACTEHGNVLHEDYGDYFNTGCGCEGVWLPRQEDLQEMLLDVEKWQTSIQDITILCAFARFCGIDDEDEEGRSNIYLRKESLEVLWLAFVMKEKFGKVWDGETWLII